MSIADCLYLLGDAITPEDRDALNEALLAGKSEEQAATDLLKEATDELDDIVSRAEAAGATVRRVVQTQPTPESLQKEAFALAERVTGTDAFSNWFGDSKVVDENGKPKILYHSTFADFSTFEKTSDLGFHFGSIFQANTRLEKAAEERKLSGAAKTTGTNIMPVYLRIENPIYLERDPGTWNASSLAYRLEQQGVLPKSAMAKYTADWREIAAILEKRNQDLKPEPSIYEQATLLNLLAMRDDLEARGYDGVTYINAYEGEGKTETERRGNEANRAWIAFRPEQVKSAIGNVGTYDITNPDITYAVAGEEAGYVNLTDIDIVGPVVRENIRQQYDAAMNDLQGRLKQVGISDRIDLRLRDVVRNMAGGRVYGARGAYMRQTQGNSIFRTIQIAVNEQNKRWAIDHEIIHGLRDLGVIRESEWRALSRAAQADTQRLESVRSRYEGMNLSEEQIMEEAIADMHADWNQGRFEAKGFVQAALKRISDFLEALGNALRGAGFQSANDIFERISRGELGARVRAQQATRAGPSLAKDVYRIERLIRSDISRVDQRSTVNRVRWVVYKNDRAFDTFDRKTDAEKFVERQLAKQDMQLARAGPMKNVDIGKFRKTKGEQIGGLPPGVSDQVGIDRVANRLYGMLDQAMSSFKDAANWYEDVGSMILRLTNHDKIRADHIARIFALLSSDDTAANNTNSLVKAAYELEQGNEQPLVGRYPNAMSRYIKAAVEADTVSRELPGFGPKTLPFYQNLHDAMFPNEALDKNAVAIDRWMLWAEGFPKARTGAGDAGARIGQALVQRVTEQYNKDHGTKLLPHQVQALIWTQQRANEGIDEATYHGALGRATETITWEAVPSPKSPEFAAFNSWNAQKQGQFLRDAGKLVTGDNGEDLIAEQLKIPLVDTHVGEGVYGGATHPNFLTGIVAAKLNGHYDTTYAEAYSAVLQGIYKQEAVPWFRLDPAYATDPEAIHAAVFEVKDLSNGELLNVAREVFGDDVGYTVDGSSVLFANYMGDEQFFEKAAELGVRIGAEPVYTGVESNYGPEIDWQTDPTGSGASSRLEASGRGSPALQAWISDRRQAFEGLARSYSQEAEPVAGREAFALGRQTPPGGRISPQFNAQRYQAYQQQQQNAVSPQGFSGLNDSVLDVVRQKVQDRFIDLKRLEEAAGPVPENQRAYLAEELYHGKAQLDIEEARETDMKPLVDAIQASGLTVEQADEYLYARHAKERNKRIAQINPLFAQGGGSGMTDAQANAILGQYRGNRAVDRIGRMFDRITQKNRDLLVSAGLEKPEVVQAWEDTYDYYAPLRGREDKETYPFPGRGRGFDVRGRSKRAYGRRSRAANPIANMLSQYEVNLIRAQKAEVGRAFLRFVEAHPDPQLWEVNKVEYTASINKSSGLVQYRQSQLYRVADNVVAVPVNGEDYYITLHGNRGTRIAGALKNVGAEKAGMFIRTFAGLNRMLALVNTGLNPQFIVSNLLRDMQTAGINLSGTAAKSARLQILKDIGKAWHGIRQAQKGNTTSQWAQYYHEFRKAGAQTGWADAHNDVERLHLELERELKRQARSAADPRTLIQTLDKFIESENMAVENATRLSAFVHARQLGMSEKQAASLAKNLTVNFNRRGEYGTLINSLYLFANASMQGSVRMLQALKSPGVRRVAGGIIVFSAMLDMLNRMVGGDDDDGVPKYDKIPDYVKERNLVMMNPWSEEGYMKIPLPWGYNVFKVMGDQIGAAASAGMGQNPDFRASRSAMNIISAVAGAFNPLGASPTLGQLISPTVFDPIISLEQNLDWAGRPIRPPEDPFETAPTPDAQKFWGSTSEMSKWITQTLNELTGGSEVRPGLIDVSPNTLDFLYGYATGGLGRFVSNMVDAPIKLLVDGEIEAYRIPFGAVVYGEVGNRATSEKFYDNIEQVYYAERELRLAVENKDPQARQEVQDKYGVYLRARLAAKAAQKQLRELRERRNIIRAQPISESLKNDRIQQIEDRIERVMLNFNRRVRQSQETQ